MQVGFGSGFMSGIRTDTTLNVTTPAQLGILQDVSVDFNFSLKKLYGQYKFPVSIAQGTGTVTGKAKFAKMNSRVYNDLIFGGTLTGGETRVVQNEGPAGGTAIPATPFTITVTNGSLMTTKGVDLGVIDAATGVQMKKVTGTPTAGQYAVVETTGVYLFSSADNVSGIKVYISYEYGVAIAAGVGSSITITNQLLGNTLPFSAHINVQFNSQQATIILNRCMSNKLNLVTKLDDYVIPEFDFEAFADAANNIGTISLNEGTV